MLRARHGPDLTIQADWTQEGLLPWTDEGAADRGGSLSAVFSRITRRRASRSRGFRSSRRSEAFAESWNAVQFQRMPNVSLLPGERTFAPGHRGRDRCGAAARGRFISRATTSSFRGGRSIKSATARFVDVKDVRQHADVLEVDGDDRRQELLLDGAARSTTRAEPHKATRLSYGRARLFPKCQHPQHGPGAHDALMLSRECVSQMLLRDDARGLTSRVLSFSRPDVRDGHQPT